MRRRDLPHGHKHMTQREIVSLRSQMQNRLCHREEHEMRRRDLPHGQKCTMQSEIARSARKGNIT
jgi:hypothetical protein